jgi:2'-hydroxyisoflavone reductase
LIVGPHDPTNRFTYWVTRLARGGEVVAPEPRDQPVQVIDARDLAEFTLTLAAQKTGGVFNAVGDVRTMGQTLEAIADAIGSEARIRWTPTRRLLEAGLEPWTDVPLWLATETDPLYRGFLAMSNVRARAAGLKLRPLADTVRDTLQWARSVAEPAGAAGLDPDLERHLLAAG